MFIIRNQQLEDLRASALKKFEGEMVKHIAGFFPNHFLVMGEEAVRTTIRYGCARAKSYGFMTKRNICLYLNTMVLLGSNFDYDPQYPWVKAFLKEDMGQDPKLRIDGLADRALEVFTQFSGKAQVYSCRALLEINQNTDAVFERLSRGNLKNALRHLIRLFPKKYEVIGEAAIRQTILHGVHKADKYGIWSESNALIFVALMFLLGSGFDEDPQFPWAGEVLNDRAIRDQGEKMGLLYHKGIDRLRNILHNRSVRHV